MVKSIYITFSFLVALLIHCQALMAGDEDMMSPYTQFDPETGFFIPIDPQTVEHQTQYQDNGNTAMSAAEPPAPQMTEDDLSSSSSLSQNHLIILSAGILLLLAGTVIIIRRARNNVGQ
jgi:hypothetical protein